jgi:hypothetical protein
MSMMNLSRYPIRLNRSKFGRPMSALGQKRTSRPGISMSAIPPKADIAKHGWDVCFVPIADMTRLFDHLTGQPVDLDQCTGEWPGRQLQKWEECSDMRTISSVRQSCKCENCGQWLMAPERSTFVSEEQITHFWVCPKCGNEFTTSFFPCPDQPLVPEIIETFLPNLLVA